MLDVSCAFQHITYMRRNEVKCKIKKQKFYTLDAIKKHQATYNLLIGERSNGKSYAVKREMIKNFIEKGERFIYLRRYNDDIKKMYVESYLSDMTDELVKLSKGFYNTFKVRNGKIYVLLLDEDEIESHIEQIGYYKALNAAERMKSNSYLDVCSIVFEEFLATNGYLGSEVELFESIISTVARRRRITVYMIGNKISRNSIYFQHFQLLKTPTQKEGTIEIYNMTTNPPQYDEDGSLISVKLAVEMCRNESNNSKMFFGHSQASITNGAWNSDAHPLYKKSDEHFTIYNLVFEFRLTSFYSQLIYDQQTGHIFWYVSRKTTPIKKNTRVISDRVNSSPLYTTSLSAINPVEELYFSMMLDKKVFFSDNLTGTEFYEALRYFRINSL